jgi:YVTN family beta-propeller protein
MLYLERDGTDTDLRAIWPCAATRCRRIHTYSLPDLKLTGEVQVGNDPDWITMTPDGKMVYVANAESNSVSAIDASLKKEVARIPVGDTPKRNITIVLK